MKKITIIDYGSGNLHSIAKAFENQSTSNNVSVTISDNYRDIEQASHIVLPGVGAYNDCISNLKNQDGILQALVEAVQISKKPFLGVCVGMQLLSDFGEENIGQNHGKHAGLGWISGTVKHLPKKDNLKIPHMGWNEVFIKQDHNIFKNIPNGSDFYFVHSYHFQCENDKNIMAYTNYGNNFTSVIAQENIVSCQFHPEKSQKHGLQFIGNFICL